MHRDNRSDATRVRNQARPARISVGGTKLLERRALGTYAIAKICHVAPVTVGRWLDDGKLPFFTTGGGHRRVWEIDLAAFLRSHNYPVPSNLSKSPSPVVLVIDDKPSRRHLMREILATDFPNFETEEAVNSYEAGEKTVALVPSLIILDVNLAGLNGLEICKRIRADKRFKRTKILAISGQRKGETKPELLKAGADAFLPAPFSDDQFKKVVRKLIYS